MRLALRLAHSKNRFLFECLPNRFPPYLTPVEMELWGLFYADLSAERHG